MSDDKAKAKESVKVESESRTEDAAEVTEESKLVITEEKQ